MNNISKKALSFCMIASLSSSVMANNNENQPFKLVPNYGNNPNIAHVLAYKTQEKILSLFGAETPPSTVTSSNPHRYAEKSSADLSEILAYNQNVTQSIAQAIGSAQPVDFSNLKAPSMSAQTQALPNSLAQAANATVQPTAEALAATVQVANATAANQAQITTQKVTELASAAPQPLLEKVKVNPEKLATGHVFDPLQLNLKYNLQQAQTLTPPIHSSGAMVITGQNTAK